MPNVQSGLGRPPAWAAYLCAAAGCLLLILFIPAALGLCLGTAGDRWLVLALMLVLAGLALFLLALDRRLAPAHLLCALLPVALAFYIRIRCLDHVTYDYLDFLSGWAAYFRDNGGWAAVKDPVGNYNAPYLYFLAAISYLPTPDLYLIKLFSVVFDLLLAWGGLRLARRLCPADSLAPYGAFCLLLLLPTVVLNGAYWGQCDSLYGALTVHAVASVLDGRPKSSVALLAVAFSFKLQTVFLIPLWCAFWLARRVRFSHLWIFPLTYLGTILPALLLGKPLWDILGVYFGQAEEYSAYLTMNAPTVYALIPYGAQVDVSLAARLGILAAFVLVLGLLAAIFFRRDQVDDQALLAAAVILAIGVPLLLPHMHERYFFLADVLSLIWACTNLRRIPQAAAVQIASLGGYHAYLVLRYAFPMAWGALLLFLALLLSAVALWHGLARQGKRRGRMGRN